MPTNEFIYEQYCPNNRNELVISFDSHELAKYSKAYRLYLKRLNKNDALKVCKSVFDHVIDHNAEIDISLIRLLTIYDEMVASSSNILMKKLCFELIITFLSLVIIIHSYGTSQQITERINYLHVQIQLLRFIEPQKSIFSAMRYLMCEWVHKYKTITYKHGIKFKNQRFNVFNAIVMNVSSWVNNINHLCLLIANYTQFKWTQFINEVFNKVISTKLLETQETYKYSLPIHFVLMIDETVKSNESILFTIDTIILSTMKMSKCVSKRPDFNQLVARYLFDYCSNSYWLNPKYFMELISYFCNDNEKEIECLLIDIFSNIQMLANTNIYCKWRYNNDTNNFRINIKYIFENILMKFYFKPDNINRLSYLFNNIIGCCISVHFRENIKSQGLNVCKMYRKLLFECILSKDFFNKAIINNYDQIITKLEKCDIGSNKAEAANLGAALKILCNSSVGIPIKQYFHFLKQQSEKQ